MGKGSIKQKEVNKVYHIHHIQWTELFYHVGYWMPPNYLTTHQ